MGGIGGMGGTDGMGSTGGMGGTVGMGGMGGTGGRVVGCVAKRTTGATSAWAPTSWQNFSPYAP